MDQSQQILAQDLRIKGWIHLGRAIQEERRTLEGWMARTIAKLDVCIGEHRSAGRYEATRRKVEEEKSGRRAQQGPEGVAESAIGASATAFLSFLTPLDNQRVSAKDLIE